MSKKIYDILPPKVAHKVEDTIKSLTSDDKKKNRPHKEVSRRSKKKKFPLKEVLFGAGVIITLFAIYFISKLPKADIQIWPKLDSIILQEKVTADKSFNVSDFSNKIIPARYLEIEKDGSQEFLATGSASNDGKASGNIKVYNKISPSAPLTLRSGTHFLSDSGKYFVTLNKVTIPAMQGKTQGSVEVKVQAEESGPSYNINSSKFSVPKLSGTAYYYSIWAESNSPMAGGYSGKVKKVTKNDIETAKNLLTKKLSTDAESSLKEKLSADYILLDGAILRNVVNVSFNVKPDAITDKFEGTAKVKISAIAFNKQDLEKFAKDYILSQLSDNKNLLEKSLTLNYNPDSIDMQDGIEKINLQISAKTYYNIDSDDLIDLSSRKSVNQIKEIISSKYGDRVSDAKIKFWPLWVKKAPKDKNRVKVDLYFE